MDRTAIRRKNRKEEKRKDRQAGGEGIEAGRMRVRKSDEGNTRCGECTVRTKKRKRRREKEREREGRAMEKTERRDKRK
jgi:hypothetical protein